MNHSSAAAAFSAWGKTETRGGENNEVAGNFHFGHLLPFSLLFVSFWADPFLFFEFVLGRANN